MENKEYLIQCWHCTAEYDALAAPSCKHADPTKICPFCLSCFCKSSDEYKNSIWESAPQEMVQEIASLASLQDVKLGEIIKKSGKISEPDLKMALEKQKILKKKIGETLINLGMITAEELQLFLMNQRGIDRIDLSDYKAEHSIFDKINFGFFLARKILPLEQYVIDNVNVLSFAFSDKEDLLKVKKSEILKDYVLLPYYAEWSEIKRCLAQISKDLTSDEIFVLDKEMNLTDMIWDIIKTARNKFSSVIFFEFKDGVLDVGFFVGKDLLKIKLSEVNDKLLFGKLKETAGIIPEEVYQETIFKPSKSESNFKIKAIYSRGVEEEYLKFTIIDLNRLDNTVFEFPFTNREKTNLFKHINQEKGLILVVSPAGIGSFETMYALMNSIRKNRIVVIESDILREDKKRFHIKVEGNQLGAKFFQRISKLEPDTIFVFNSSSIELSQDFFKFAAKGKLVLEMRANSYAKVFSRLLEEFQLSADHIKANLNMIIFQQQLKILCPKCKIRVKQIQSDILRNVSVIYEEKGCQECDFTGFRGSEDFSELFFYDKIQHADLDFANPGNIPELISRSGELTIAKKVLDYIIKGKMPFKEYLEISKKNT